jgi:hypothetical protein
MRERGISTIPAVALAALAGLVTSLFLMNWMVVDVRPGDPDAPHIKVPVPLLAARVAAGFVPDEVLEDAQVPPEVKEHREAVLNALEALIEAPDATFVRVDTDDEHVLIDKVGSDLQIAVDADDARVRCTVPIDGVLDALEHWDWETADPSLVFRVLSAAGNGNLVTVEADDGTRVTINMW